MLVSTCKQCDSPDDICGRTLNAYSRQTPHARFTARGDLRVAIAVCRAEGDSGLGTARARSPISGEGFVDGERFLRSFTKSG